MSRTTLLGTSPRRERPARLVAVTALLAVAVPLAAAASAGWPAATATSPAAPPLAAAPRAHCGAGSAPETAAQGRVPLADVQSGRAVKGYRCNSALVAHVESPAGYKVQRYADKTGHECAYYDSTRAFPADTPRGALGTYVVDMSRPARPVVTTRLVTPGMLSPHESLLVDPRRGLLVAAQGYVTTLPAVVDVYDVSRDCRAPVLRSSTPLGILGHESGFSPDGLTYYVTSLSGPGFTALGLEDPSHPTLLFYGALDVRGHGLSLSDDGRRLYATNAAGTDGGRLSRTEQLVVLDVSDIQERKPEPQVHVVSALSYPDHSYPQKTEPFSVRGHRYLMEVDEFAPDDKPGAARIIDLADERRPRVLAHVRLEVQMPGARKGSQAQDPGAAPAAGLGGYSAHYCSIPRRDDPQILACTMIKSGLRLFDIRDPAHPREVAYFNQPPSSGTSDAVSSIAFAPARREVWFSDSNSGFWAVRLARGAWSPAPPRR